VFLGFGIWALLKFKVVFRVLHSRLPITSTLYCKYPQNHIRQNLSQIQGNFQICYPVANTPDNKYYRAGPDGLFVMGIACTKFLRSLNAKDFCTNFLSFINFSHFFKIFSEVENFWTLKFLTSVFDANFFDYRKFLLTFFAYDFFQKK
jgi:hypothetical protein